MTKRNINYVEIIYNKIFDYLSNLFKEKKIKEKTLELLISAWPDNEDRLISAKGIGGLTVENLGHDDIINAFKNLDESLHIEDLSLSKENCFKECKDICAELCNAQCVPYDVYIKEFFSNIPHIITDEYGFNLSAKMIRNYLIRKGFIIQKEDENNILVDYASNESIKHGFKNIIEENQLGVMKNHIKLSWKAQLYLRTLLPDIFYDYFGYNAVLLMKKIPDYAELIFSMLDEQESIKNILILDLDATIFDTDFIRIERKTKFWSITEQTYKNIEYIEGFENIFLNSNSPFDLKKNIVLIITNSRYEYAKKLIDLHPELKQCSLCASVGSEKSNKIREFIKSNSGNYKEIYAFGDDEKDALLYSTLGLKYYIVNNYYGYDNNPETILNSLTNNGSSKFRKRKCYDIISCNIYDKYEQNEFFDDMVVYYERFYDKTSTKQISTHFLHKERMFREILTHSEFALYDGAKTYYAKLHSDEIIRYDLSFIKDLTDMEIRHSYFVKVPGHDETILDKEQPGYILIQKALEKIDPSRNLCHALLRTEVTEESHGLFGKHHGVRYHSNTIKINPLVKNLIRGKTIYLFDDIVTSGASMMACMKKLYEAGAGHVVCICLARTMPRDGFGLQYLEGGKI